MFITIRNTKGDIVKLLTLSEYISMTVQDMERALVNGVGVQS